MTVYIYTHIVCKTLITQFNNIMTSNYSEQCKLSHYNISKVKYLNT